MFLCVSNMTQNNLVKDFDERYDVMTPMFRKALPTHFSKMSSQPNAIDGLAVELSRQKY